MLNRFRTIVASFLAVSAIFLGQSCVAQAQNFFVDSNTLVNQVTLLGKGKLLEVTLGFQGDDLEMKGLALHSGMLARFINDFEKSFGQRVKIIELPVIPRGRAKAFTLKAQYFLVPPEWKGAVTLQFEAPSTPDPEYRAPDNASDTVATAYSIDEIFYLAMISEERGLGIIRTLDNTLFSVSHGKYVGKEKWQVIGISTDRLILLEPDNKKHIWNVIHKNEANRKDQ